MPTFEVQGPDGKTYELDGPSMDWAISAFKGFSSSGPTKKAEFPSWLEHQKQIAGEALETMKGGARQVSEGAAEDDFFKRARGAGKAAAGAIGYVASPIQSALRTAVGRPVQEATGIPEQYTELAAGLAIPGVGLTRTPAALRLREPPSVPPSLGPAPKGANAPRTLDELGEDVAQAVTRPTGGVVPQAEAGAAVRRAAEAYRPPEPPIPSVDEWITQAGAPRPRAPGTDDWIGGVKTARGDEWISRLPKAPVERGPWGPTAAEGVPDPMSARVRLIAKGGIPEERVVANLIDEAEGGGHAALSHFRKITPAEDWAKVQSASLGQLGRTGELGGQVGWDPIVALRRYDAIPDKGKGLLFGQPVTVAGRKLQAGLRPHMDSLVEDMKRLDKLTETTGTAVPMPTEAMVRLLGMSGETILRLMGQPSAAASIAHWSRAYARLIERGKTPAAIAALTLATRNLENTIGSAEAGTRSIADINKPLPEEEEARRRVNERAGVEVPRGNFENFTSKGYDAVIGTLAQMKRDLPYEKMRRSTRVDDFSGVPPSPPDISDVFAGRFIPNAEYGGRMQRGVPLDALNVAAGLGDLSQLQSMARRR